MKLQTASDPTKRTSETDSDGAVAAKLATESSEMMATAEHEQRLAVALSAKEAEHTAALSQREQSHREAMCTIEKQHERLVEELRSSHADERRAAAASAD